MDLYFSKCTFYDEYDNKLNSHCLDIEHATRYLANKYIQTDMKILELGSRYGTVSCALDYGFICVETFVDSINLNNKCWIKK